MPRSARKTVLTLVLAFALLALGLQASVWMPPAATGGIDRLANYSAIPMQSEAKAALLAKNNGSKTYHLPSGNFVGNSKVLKDPKSVGTTTVSSKPMALAIVFDFAPNAADAKDIVPGTNLYTPVPLSKFQDLLYGTMYNPYSLSDFSTYATYKATPTSTPVTAPTNRTLKNYLLEVSDGRITDFTGDVVRVTLPHPYSYYFVGKAYGPLGLDNANADYSIGEILMDAIVAADTDPLNPVDFSQYAAPGESIQNVFFIHAGSGAEWSGASDIIWSHSWEYASAYCYWMYAQTGDATWLTDDGKYESVAKGFPVDGVYVNNYSIEPEVGGDLTGFTGAVSGPYPPDVGVYAHEYAHVMGAPDEYDYGYESEGTGIYSLMSSGSWTRWPNAPQYSGNTPVMLDAWCRVYLGFASGSDLATVTASGSAPYILEPVSVGGGVLKLVVPGTGGSEYFLVEYRSQVPGTFDTGLGRSSAALGIDGSKIHGLAIYHVDENVLARNFSRASEAPAISQKTEWNMSVDKANGEWHYGVSILQADGRWQLERGTGYYGENHLYKAGFSFGPKTYPASSSYFTNFAVQGKNISPNYSGVFVKNIVENPPTTQYPFGSVSFIAGIG